MKKKIPLATLTSTESLRHRVPAAVAASASDSGAHALVGALIEQDVDTVFLAQLDDTVHALWAVLKAHKGMQVVRLAQDRAAVHAAEGYARMTGRIAAVVVAAGPGIAAAMPALLSAMTDSVPLLCICGQVSSELIGSDGFKESDALGMTLSVTKWNTRITNVDDIGLLVTQAARTARHGRMAPVVIEVPIDIQRACAATACRQGPSTRRRRESALRGNAPPERQIDRAAALMASAERPLFYCGGGLIRSGAEACATLNELVHLLDAPCALTMTSVGVLPTNDLHLVGILGIRESSVAHQAMRHADLVIGVGARFDERSYPRHEDPARDPTLIHIDIDPATINKVVKADAPLVGDCGEILLGLGRRLLDFDLRRGRLDAWWRQIDAWATVASTEVHHDREGGVTPRQLMLALRDSVVLRDAVVAVDNGEYRSLAALLLPHAGPRRWLVSGGVAAPGFALAAAIGAAVANPGRVLVCITDENSLLATVQELHTVARDGWPVKLFALASRSPGFQAPGVLSMARSFGWLAHSVDSPLHLERAVHECLVSPGPALLEVVTSQHRMSSDLTAIVSMREMDACEHATH